MMTEIRNNGSRMQKMEDALITPIEMSRKKAKTTNQDAIDKLPALTPELEELEKEYQVKHVDAKALKKSDLTSHVRAGQNRYVNSKIFDDHGFILYSDDVGVLECLICKLGGYEWNTKQIQNCQKVEDHKDSEKHKHAFIVAKTRIRFKPEAIEGYTYLTRQDPVFPFEGKKNGKYSDVDKKNDAD